MKKKIIFSAGGTGGHLFPAQATAAELSDCEILFVAGKLSNSKYFDRDTFNFEDIDAATFSLKSPLSMIKGAGKIASGISKSLRIIDKFSPDLIVGFGSFYTLPVLVGGALRKIPFILHEQNAVPGKVNKLFSRFAKATAVTFPNMEKIMRGNVVETKFPLRKNTSENQTPFNASRPTLLIFGGSQGAKFLNKICLDIAHRLASFNIVHYTGNEDDALHAQKIYQEKKIPHCVKAFEPNLREVMAQSEIVICRAGASTLAELIDHEKPALLIPFPFAAENHQEKNARHFVHEIGGGEMCLEKDLCANRLFTLINSLYQNRLEKKRKIQEYKEQKSLKSLSQLIRECLNEK